MLQRIQTIWLLLAASCAFASLKFPFYSGTTPALIPGHAVNGTENFKLLGLTLVVGIVATVCIFLYSNRTLQIRLTIVNILLQIGLIFLYVIEVKNYQGGTYALSAILQIIILFALIFSAKGIYNDSRIIKQSNRLR